MTHVLKAKTHPFREKIPRIHAPFSNRGQLKYPAFKECLRWEFGFTCAICLLHEVHLVLPGTGAGKTGQMTIEHVVLKSTPDGAILRDTYSNCLLVCKFCNNARGDRHSHQNAGGTRLLNPVDDVWANHFDLVDDRLDPRSGDSNAMYTHHAYKMSDSIRTLRRQKLREKIDGLLTTLTEENKAILEIDARLASPSIDDNERQRLRSDRGRCSKRIDGDRRILLDLAGVPKDAPAVCRCSTPHAPPKPVSDNWQLPPLAPQTNPSSPQGRRFRI